MAERRLRHIYTRRPPVVDTPDNRSDPFAVRLWAERLDQPVRGVEPRMIFVNSMSDLFHHDVPDEFVRTVFEVMLAARQHIYQVLTKRPARAAKFWRKHRAGLGLARIPSHIWIGASVENRKVDYRVRHLRAVEAETRFLSCEPVLGPLDGLDLTGIHWVIGGGESGAGARSVDPSWAIGLRNLCLRSHVPFFWKQWGGRTPKAGGRLLDGEEWNQFPDRVPARVA